MAKLGATFDATGIEPIQPLELLPPGKYIAQIVSSEMRLTKDGKGQYLFLEMDVLEGPYQGRKLFDRLNLVNANTQTVEIAQRTLSAICHATGRMQVEDSERAAPDSLPRGRDSPAAEERLRRDQQDPLPAVGGAGRVQPAAHDPPPTPAASVAPATGGFTTAPWKRST